MKYIALILALALTGCAAVQSSITKGTDALNTVANDVGNLTGDALKLVPTTVAVLTVSNTAANGVAAATAQPPAMRVAPAKPAATN